MRIRHGRRWCRVGSAGRSSKGIAARTGACSVRDRDCDCGWSLRRRCLRPHSHWGASLGHAGRPARTRAVVSRASRAGERGRTHRAALPRTDRHAPWRAVQGRGAIRGAPGHADRVDARAPGTRSCLLGEYQNLWGQTAMAISIRGAIHRLHDQKLRRPTCPHKSTPHTFWYSPQQRMPEWGTSETAGAAGGQLPAVTRPSPTGLDPSTNVVSIRNTEDRIRPSESAGRRRSRSIHSGVRTCARCR